MGEQNLEEDMNSDRVKLEDKSACKRKSKHGHQMKRRSDLKDKVEQLCRVCAEQAAGYHYGVFTCEGCKSFFGRYQKGKRKPPQECMNGQGQCDVKSRARNRCRYCRYQKCLNAGMSKSASRYGRRSNWFKVHCLSEAQDEDVKNVILARSESKRSSDDHLSPQTSVIMPPSIINPKPMYPIQQQSPNFSTIAVIQSNPLYLSNKNGSMPNGYPSSSLMPLHNQLFFPPTPATSAFAPMFGYFPNIGFQSILLDHPSMPLVQKPDPIEPVQNEPLDLSLKTTSLSFKNF